jgi:hypothetical protein
MSLRISGADLKGSIVGLLGKPLVGVPEALDFLITNSRQSLDGEIEAIGSEPKSRPKTSYMAPKVERELINKELDSIYALASQGSPWLGYTPNWRLPAEYLVLAFHGKVRDFMSLTPSLYKDGYEAIKKALLPLYEDWKTLTNFETVDQVIPVDNLRVINWVNNTFRLDRTVREKLKSYQYRKKFLAGPAPLVSSSKARK